MMGDGPRFNSSYSYSPKGSNRDQDQLEGLRNTMKAIKAITDGFRLHFRGENSRLDSLIDNVNIILEKQSCLNSGLGGRNRASGPVEICGSSRAAGVELESLKAGLQSIQLQVAAFRALAEDHCNLNLLLQNLDACIAKHLQVLPSSIRIKNNNVQPPVRVIPSASAKVEIIDLEPGLPDSTFEIFDIETRSEVGASGADEIISLNLNPVSASSGDGHHVGVVEMPICGSFLAHSTSQNRKRKTYRNGTKDSGANVASKTSKVVTKPESLPSSTRPSVRKYSGEDNHIDSDSDLNFIRNNVNLGKVKIEVDHKPSGRNQNGELIKEENLDVAAADDDDVEMSDKSSIEKDKKFSEKSLDPEANNGLGEAVQGFALNLPNKKPPSEQHNRENIFEQNKILTAIFKNLDVESLQEARFVNKQWKRIADARIVHEKLWKLVIDKTFSKQYQGKTLEDLNDCIDNSNGGFPLTTLIFGYIASQCNDYTKPKLLRFYRLHGTKITSLKLPDFRASAGALHDLLLNRLPNIENIYIGTIWLTTDEKLLTSSNSQELIMLPKLKTIRFGLDIDPRNKAHQAIFKAFLASAVNLKEIENVRSHMLPCIAQAGKLNCVKNFKFFPRIFVKAHTKTCWPKKKVSTFEQPTDRASFGKLIELQPKLSTLEINVSTLKCRELVPQYITGLNKILLLSKDTLKRLQIPSFFFVPGLVIPNLQNLEHLEVNHRLSVKNLDPPSIFPGNLNLRETFPNVRVFSCDLVGIGHETDWIAKYFPTGNNNNNENESSSSSRTFEMSRSFPSVTRLKFEHHYNFGKSLELYFPMLTEIICYKFDVTHRNRVHIGTNSGLKEATIGITSLQLWGLRLSGEKSSLDELFTGISRLECVRLNDGKTHSTAQAGNHLFQNLKSLRRLIIVFDHFDNSKLKPTALSGYESSPDHPLACAVITPVSYRYAFALMENLEEVWFAYDHYLPVASDFAKILEPFAAFPAFSIFHESNQITAA